ncbi:MAG: pentapeptide repeat-containing protein [Phototrophicaceae bacterium]
MTPKPLNRAQETQQIYKKYDYLYRYLRGFVLVIFGIWLGSLFFSDMEGYATNVFTEIIGIFATYLIFDEITKRAAKQEQRDHLFSELNNPSISPAVNALDQLRRDDALPDDYFIGINLRRANWEGAYIGGINFEKAQLDGVNFKFVTSHNGDKNHKVNFKGVNLRYANLSGANLWKADFTCADLRFITLANAFLGHANLEGVYLKEAQLDDVTWMSRKGYGEATLPDGQQWTPDIDLARYTHPEHPDYKTTLEKINAIRIAKGYEVIVF